MSYQERQIVKQMIDPFIFKEKLLKRLQQADVIDKNSLFTFTKLGYQELCTSMERLVIEVKHQRDLWKDRFFFTGMYMEEGIVPYTLCDVCKDEMYEAFFHLNEIEAPKWRPGKTCYSSMGCKGFCMDSF